MPGGIADRGQTGGSARRWDGDGKSGDEAGLTTALALGHALTIHAHDVGIKSNKDLREPGNQSRLIAATDTDAMG